jgi:RsiW-degrading membrane proteinase PrsW (M82 family)
VCIFNDSYIKVMNCMSFNFIASFNKVYSLSKTNIWLNKVFYSLPWYSCLVYGFISDNFTGRWKRVEENASDTLCSWILTFVYLGYLHEAVFKSNVLYYLHFGKLMTHTLLRNQSIKKVQSLSSIIQSHFSFMVYTSFGCC